MQNSDTVVRNHNSRVNEIESVSIQMRSSPPLVNELLGCGPEKIDRIKQDWQNEALWLWRQALRKRTLAVPVEVEVSCVVSDRQHLFDADGIALAEKWLLDAFVQEGGIPDDAPEYVKRVVLNAATVDRSSRLPITTMTVRSVF